VRNNPAEEDPQLLSGDEDSARIVGNPSLTGLGKACPSSAPSEFRWRELADLPLQRCSHLGEI